MEPGEFLTNVLSLSNLSTIDYSYFEPQGLSAGSTRKRLQNLEAGWRRDGRLVYRDPIKDGLWLFQSLPGGQTDESRVGTNVTTIGDVSGLGLVQLDSGSYEPASLLKNKQASSNTITTPSSSSSPSSSTMESAFRNAQAMNARSTQMNASVPLQEPPTPSPGTKSGTSATTATRTIHEYFISSMLGSIVYFLCRNHSFIPFNSRTLIFPRDSDDSIQLATLDISLSSLGTLVIKATCNSAAGIRRLPDGLEDLMSGTALWLAPGGNAARFRDTLGDKTLPFRTGLSRFEGDDSETRLSALDKTSILSWQTKCLEWLTSKGMDVTPLLAGGWILVQFLDGGVPYLGTDFQRLPVLDDPTVLPWPARLCFRSSSQNNHHQAAMQNHRDPLSFAEEWFSGNDDRFMTITKRTKDRQAADALSREQADVDARANQSQAYPSAILRRGSNSGAVYPTPPDAPHPTIGATPNFDGNVSTPGNPHTFVSSVDPINVVPANIGTDNDMWDSSEKKEKSLPGLNFNENEQDNNIFFGDLGGDMFGNDITDADFSFFDEPDDIHMEIDPNNTVTKLLQPAQSTSITVDDDNQPPDRPVGSEDIKLVSIPISSPQAQEDESRPQLFTKTIDFESTAMGKPKSTTRKATFVKPITTFNMETVFNQLSREFSDKQKPEPRRPSLFEEVRFQKSLLSLNQKYNTLGRFKFLKNERKARHSPVSTLPQTDYLSKRRRTQDYTNQPGSLAQILVHDDQATSNGLQDHAADSECGSQISEQDDASPQMSDVVSFSMGKRKFENDTFMSSSFGVPAMDSEPIVSTPQSNSSAQMPVLDCDPADWPLAPYLSCPEPDARSIALSDQESIATAQILADQAISSTLQVGGVEKRDITSSSCTTATARQLMKTLTKICRLCLADPKVCNLRSFLEIPGIPAVSQGLRLPPRPVTNPRGPNNQDPQKLPNPYTIAPPQLEIRRSESKLSLQPAAITFWGNLGLGPSRGTKDVQAICLYPELEGVSDNARLFVDTIRSVYESSRFGCHDTITTKDFAGGLIPFSTEPGESTHIDLLKDIPGRMGRILASLSEEKQNFVVYFLCPIQDKGMLVNICSSFRHLFHLYKKILNEKRIAPANELVLQVIPLEFVTRLTSLSVPLPSQLFTLAIEVYDRCTDFTSMACTPAIILEQTLPKTIDFKLNATPSASLLHENTCLHVAYAQSIDDRWITAAWTDNRGTQQMTSSYCLGRKNEPISMSFFDVASEIWETTLELISSKRIHWRIIIARLGVLDPSEQEFWTSLASTETSATLSLTLVTVQTDPSLQLLPSPSSIIPSGASAPAVVTPVSTPQASQASILSPDSAATPVRDGANAATPNETPTEPDIDARLIDLTDQTWGAVLSHRLNNSNSLVDINPALISGYLIKRGGTNADDPPVVMEVNIIHSEIAGNPRTFHESLLKEILGYYRGLGTLARVRGIVDSVKDVRPWHIAAAEKAVTALYMLM